MGSRKTVMERISTDTLHFSCWALALPPGELSPQVTERVLQSRSTLSVFTSLSHLSQRERQEQAQQMILLCLLPV